MKKIITLIIIITMLMPMTVQAIETSIINGIFQKLENPTANAQEKFKDMDHWSNEVVSKLVDLEIIDGYSDKTFRPENTIKRCEFSKIIRTALRLEIQTGNSFEDTKEHWVKDEIYTLVQSNIIIPSEYGQDYEPEESITRIEMAKMIVRAIGINENVDGLTINFNDKDKIQKEDLEFVYIASKHKIINGYPDNTFRPDNNAKRSEACKMIINMYNAMKESNNEENSNANNDISNNNNQGQTLDEKLAHLYAYPITTVDYYDEENHKNVTKESDIKTSNDNIKSYFISKNDPELICKNAKEELNLLFNRDYENMPSDYKSQLDYYIFGEWYYRNTKYCDMEFTKLWIDETERWNVKSEAEFLTNDNLVYKDKDSRYAIRGILRIKYENHDNPDNIQWELEREGTNLELGVWYEADVDITFRRPIMSSYICDRDNHSIYSLSYYTYLSDFKEVE